MKTCLGCGKEFSRDRQRKGVIPEPQCLDCEVADIIRDAVEVDRLDATLSFLKALDGTTLRGADENL